MSDDGGLWLLAMGPAGATALYWGLYRYYRNTDKSHDFEHETSVVAKPVTGSDFKVDVVKGTRATRFGQQRERVPHAREADPARHGITQAGVDVPSPAMRGSVAAEAAPALSANP